MHEHTIPESLIEQIRTGKAALVVGAGIGVPSWKQLLERITKVLETRGREGDDAATKDVEKLLHKGSLVRAVGFLARAVGEDTCDRIVQEVWSAPAETPALPKMLARLPFRHVWTTFPGDIIEHALETGSPDEWPRARVVTYQELGELSLRRRTLVKLFGNFETYVVTPASIRRALSRAVDLREYARELYVEGSLVFVGFRYGDPDLAALLDRVFGVFEPPRGTHYFLGAGVGPVTVDELMADRIWTGTLALARMHIDAGQRVWLVTAAPVEVGAVIAQRLGLTGAIGTVAEIKDGVYTGRLVGGLMHGPQKAAAIADLAEREGLDLARCAAYSDSINDVPMLSAVGRPVAVNPDSALRRAARDRGWEIRDFRSGRRAAKVAVPTALGAGVVAGAVAAAVALNRRGAFRMLRRHGSLAGGRPVRHDFHHSE